MRNSILDFYYFSGTGNTLLVVKEMIKFFRKNNLIVNLKRIEVSDPSQINTDHLIGLAFPVAAQSTHEFLWDFFKSITSTKQETAIFMVDTLAGFSGGVVGPLKSILKSKGYKPIASKEIKMPNNLNFKEFNEVKSDKKIQKGLKTAKKFAHDLLFGLSKWQGLPIPNLIHKVSTNAKTWEFLRRKFRLDIDESKCIKCGLCYKLCPVDNIEMHPYPEFSDHCQLCMRCISFCPTFAIFNQFKPIHTYTACKSDEILKAK